MVRHDRREATMLMGKRACFDYFKAYVVCTIVGVLGIIASPRLLDDARSGAVLSVEAED